MSKDLTQERAKQVVSYCPDTGAFTWLESRGWRRKVGAPAGTPSDQHGRKYLVMSIDGRMYRAHRIAWLLVHGHWPSGDVDHKNGVTLDNRLANLRECTRAQNLWNSRTQERSKSGAKGVYWCKRDKIWFAMITHNTRVRRLGSFRDFESARAARLKAEAELHGEFARRS